MLAGDADTSSTAAGFQSHDDSAAERQSATNCHHLKGDDDNSKKGLFLNFTDVETQIGQNWTEGKLPSVAHWQRRRSVFLDFVDLSAGCFCPAMVCSSSLTSCHFHHQSTDCFRACQTKGRSALVQVRTAYFPGLAQHKRG